ncbi:MAG: serine/threonine-protein kinase [Planctomycetota bacterium]|jgi:serine/threonine protein kinase
MPLSVDDFLKNILRSGVIERETLQSALRALPASRRDQPQSVADSLVAGKLLTPFQARKLLSGMTMGLRMGPYIIQTPVGKGGMGTVYLASDTRTRSAVAIKVLSPKRMQEGKRHLARFQREMALSQKMRHPNIAMAVDVGEVQGVHFIALEYIPGVTLYRLIVRDGVLTAARAALLFAEVCAALEYAHGQGMIHRDIKPTNIMVTPDEHAKVLDLGLALMEGEEVDDPELLGGKGYIVGSVEYIAPEQTRDPTQVDARSDLYALGCTIYFALTGRGPFVQGTSRDKVRAHRLQEAEPIQQRNPAIPDGLARLVQRLMAKDPAARPASAAEVRRELLAFCDPNAVLPTCDSLGDFAINDPFDFGDAPDTLGEAFDFETSQAEFSPTISTVNLRKTARTSSSSLMIWYIAGAVAVGVLLLVLAVLATQIGK